jgi:hypothetical protein
VQEGPIGQSFVYGSNHPLRVLHKSRPFIEFLPIEEPLQNGPNTIAKVKVSTDPGSWISFRQLSLQFGGSPELTIDLNGITYPWTMAGMKFGGGTADGVDVPSGFAQLGHADGNQSIPFSGGKPNFCTYELEVNVGGVVSGSWIKTSLFVYDKEEGYGGLSLLGVEKGPGDIGFLSGVPCNAPNSDLGSSGFLWSDWSEGQDHNPLYPSSCDVFTKALVQGANGYALVTAP